MDHTCLTIPILPGKTDAALGLMRALGGDHRVEYEASLRRLGVTKQLWFLADGTAGDELVAYAECAACDDLLDRFARTRTTFDRWFEAALADATGVDLGDLPSGTRPPQLLFRYSG
jgi:hypothetical protein